MKMQFMRRLALLCAVLACGALLALPAAAAQTEAPCAEDGDMDYIRSYVVTVDPREDGSADITYDRLSELGQDRAGQFQRERDDPAD